MKKGFAFHCHHDVLVEYVHDYDERVKFIKEYKPKSEQGLRLKLFKLIPDELAPGKDSAKWEACDKAREACDKAREAYTKAREAYDKAREAYTKAREAYDKAWEACDKARVAYDKARVAYVAKFGTELQQLHENLCLDCPWDGHTIFPRRSEK